jgi:hypothetical protein
VLRIEKRPRHERVESHRPVRGDFRGELFNHSPVVISRT